MVLSRPATFQGWVGGSVLSRVRVREGLLWDWQEVGQAQFSLRRVNGIPSLLGAVSRRSSLFCRGQDRVRAGSFWTT